jgi:vacuolar-type H+-ATPase subunit I/STV1
VERSFKEMSETLWGVCLGGTITIIGMIIQNRFSSNQTKMQIEARRDELNEKFKQDLRIIQLNKKIELRSSYLQPLRRHLATLYELYLDIEEQLRYIISKYGDTPALEKQYSMSQDSRVKEIEQELENNEAKIQQLDGAVEQLMAQNTDDAIHIIDFMIIFEPSKQLTEVRRFLKYNRREVMNFRSISDSFRDARTQIQEANTNIEHILCGETEN